MHATFLSTMTFCHSESIFFLFEITIIELHIIENFTCERTNNIKSIFININSKYLFFVKVRQQYIGYIRMLVRCCYNVVLAFTCFHLTKDCNAFFQPKTFVASFLILMVLFYKEIINRIIKHQFVILICCKA